MDLAPAAPAIDIDPEAAREVLGGRLIGPHVPIKTGLRHAAERVRIVGAGAVQVFTDNPTAWVRRHQAHEGLDAFRRRLEEWRIEQVAVHASYLVNLATPDANVLERSRTLVCRELDAARGFGARYLNIHIGSHKGTGIEAGIDRVGESLARILDDRPRDEGEPRLVLEDSAGQGASVGVTIEELGAIMDAAGQRGADRSRLGICLDTAHLWGAGYELDAPEEIDRLIDTVDDVMGPSALAMLHINDSQVKRASRLDRHEHIAAGGIGVVGFRHLIRHPRLANLPMILETPGMDSGWDAVNMDRVRRLLTDAPIDPLPPGASDGTGERA